ncbi:hypothetical protein IIA95_00800 [Patescibacteria group bacterium]|nr:hypothetical protein [Patescibacteria group bacterium]
MPEGQQTLIPKTTMARVSYRSRGLGLFLAGSGLFFAITLLVSLGLFFYKGLLANQMDEFKNVLSRVESEFEPALIVELRQTAEGIDIVKGLLRNHVAPSRLFKFLEENTLPDTRFSRFSYTSEGVVMSGTTRSYTTFAQQSRVFEKHPLVKDVRFSGFSLGRAGFVNYNVELMMDPSLLLYQGP